MKLLMLRKRVAAQAGVAVAPRWRWMSDGRSLYIAQWRGGGEYNIYNIHRLLRFDFHPCARFRQFSQKYTYNNSCSVSEEGVALPTAAVTDFSFRAAAKIRKYVYNSRKTRVVLVPYIVILKYK